jgi:hypothetical protein
VQEIQKWLSVGHLSSEKLRRVLQPVCKQAAQSNKAFERDASTASLSCNFLKFMPDAVRAALIPMPGFNHVTSPQ